MSQKANFMAVALFSLLLTSLFAPHQGRELQVGVEEQQYGYCTPVPCYHTPGGLCYCCPKWNGCPLNFDTPDKCKEECPK